MTRIRADFARSHIPDNVQIGDRLTITGTAHVTGIVADHIEVTGTASTEPEFMPGERTITLIVVANLQTRA